MGDVSNSQTPLKASFKIKLNGESVAIATVGQAYRFITSLSTVEWMEFRSLHDDAKVALEAAAENAILSVQATNALRMLFARDCQKPYRPFRFYTNRISESQRFGFAWLPK
jgi:hypothetical protein